MVGTTVKGAGTCAAAGAVSPVVLLLLAALCDAARAAGPQRALQAERRAHAGHALSRAVTVVVNFNQHNGVNLEVVHALHTAYSAAFHRVVFTGQDRPDGVESTIAWSSCEFEWTFFSLCLAYTMAEYPEAPEGGYIFVGDDSVRPEASCLERSGAAHVQLRCLAAACTAAQRRLLLRSPASSMTATALQERTDRGKHHVQVMDPCRMASLNLTKFWTPPLQLVPNKREDRDTSAWCKPPARGPSAVSIAPVLPGISAHAAGTAFTVAVRLNDLLGILGCMQRPVAWVVQTPAGT